MKENKVYRPFRAFGIGLLLVVIIATVSLWGAYRMLAANQTETVLRFSERNVELAQNVLLSLIERAGDDALFLAHLTSLQDYLANPTESNLTHVTEDFRAFAEHSEDVYYMVRYIDLTGQEEIRVIETMPGFASIPRMALGNKSSRHYFQDCAQLDGETIYVSALELSSADTIGAKLAPSLRFGSPVYDRHGQKRGVVLLNYEGRELFGAIGEENPEQRGWDLTFFGTGNDHYDNEIKGGWWFTYPNQLEYESPFPSALDSALVNISSGTERINGNIYSIRTIYPLVDGQVGGHFDKETLPQSLLNLGGSDYQWKFVLTAPREWIIRDVKRQIKTITIVAGMGLGPILFLLWLMVTRQQKRFYARQLEVEHKQLQMARRLARTIAHEFRQPLAGLQLVADLMESDIENEKKIDFINRVPKFVGRLNKLVSKLLTLSEMRSIPYIEGVEILDLSDEESNAPETTPQETVEEPEPGTEA